MGRSTEPNRVFPIFVGSGRSGTTLVRTMFNAHPDLAVAMEAHFLVPLVQAEGRITSGDGLDAEAAGRIVSRSPGLGKMQLSSDDAMAAISEARPRTAAEAARAVMSLYASGRGKPLYGDKTPGYVKHIELLAHAFPEARFVHIIRDGRDTAASFLAREFGPRTIGEAAVQWKESVDAGRSGGQSIGSDRYTELSYENLIRDTKAETSRISSFLGIPASEQVLEHWKHPDEDLANMPVADRHAASNRRPEQGLRSWRDELTASQIATFETIAGDTLAACGYELVADVTLASRARATRDWLGWKLRGARTRARRSARSRLKR